MPKLLIIVFLTFLGGASISADTNEDSLSSLYDIRPINDIFAICSSAPESVVESNGNLIETRKVYGYSKNMPNNVPKEKLLASFFAKKKLKYKDHLLYLGISGKIFNLKADRIIKYDSVSFAGGQWLESSNKQRTEDRSTLDGFAKLVVVFIVILFGLPFLFFSSWSIKEMHFGNMKKKMFKLEPGAIDIKMAISSAVTIILTLIFLITVKDDGKYGLTIGLLALFAAFIHAMLCWQNPFYFFFAVLFPTVCVWKILDFEQGMIFFCCCLASMILGLFINLSIDAKIWNKKSAKQALEAET